MNLDKLKSLMLVAELGSLKAASDVAHLTQSAVSQHLKDLEEEFDAVLIDRSRRPLSMTKDGEALVEVTRQMFRLWNKYKDHTSKTKFRGNLILGHVSSAITSVVTNALVVLRTKYPALTIKMVKAQGVSKLLCQEVIHRKIDASLVQMLPQIPEELLWKPYSVERFYVIAPKSAVGKTDEELLRQGPYLRFKPSALSETNLDREIKRRGIPVDPVIELETYEHILFMVEQGVGIGIVPDAHLSKQKFAKLHCVAFGTPPFTRQMGLIVRNDSQNIHLVDLLWSVLKNLSTSG